ncbi:hypothetical protein F3Y22_tig00112762pilonHSYRG00050 [Hibiscus syriacus]|uniref:Integrase catalytic domain-containing protein n=1 Tax=Hibiscus syriacus TaxID=106335 RepID=A0A6A2XZQ9_HIBSY|nr:hypothetical protein F3Y22_tig00112762pilonHSYRG00050 [Hibiscus syriacus]
MLDVLFQQGLDIAIEEEKPEYMEEKEWGTNNHLACNTIRSCLSKEQKYGYKNETSTSKIWKALEKKFLKKSSQNSLYMKKRLFRFDYQPGTRMNEHITAFNELVAYLLGMDKTFKDEDLALMLLSSLPDEFEHLETMLLHGKDNVTLKDVTAALYSYELRKKTKKESKYEVAEAMMARGRSKSQKLKWRERSKLKSKLGKDECAFCHEKGHWKKDCPKLKKKGKAAPDACSIRLKNQDGSTRVLTDVRYVPSLKKNLISLGALESKGSLVTMRDGVLKVTYGALVMMKGITKNNLYYYQDDFSIRVWVYPMKSKYEVLQIFLKWKNMIENQTGRKIKRLRTDNGGEYKSDPFFDVFHEYGIVRHFTVRNTPQQNGVAERMNRTLLEKVRCMLSNAGLGKAFWAEVVTYIGHLINHLPSSVIGGKTPLEVWSGKPATDYDSLHVFGFTAYYHVKEFKLDPRAKNALFMGITHGVKGFHLWCLDTNKIICSRDVTFDEFALVKKVTNEAVQTSSTPQQVEHIPKQVEFQQTIIPEVDATDSSTPIEESEDEEVQTQESLETPKLLAVIRPRREIRRPARFVDMVAYALPVVDDDIPITYQESIQSLESDKWKSAMDEEIKKDVRYKAWLIAKGYAQKEGINYNEVFSPVVKHSSVRILLAMVAQLNLELAQLDAKTAFLHAEQIAIWIEAISEAVLKDGSFIYLLLYVDDMLIASKSQKEIDKLKAQLNQEFEMKDLGEAKKILEREYMAKVPYANVVGSLMYAMVCTRPNISQAVGFVSRYMHDPGERHWRAVKWILRYLQQTVDVGLVFEQDEALGQCVVGYANSDYAGDLDKRRSTTGYLFTLAKAPSTIHLAKNQVYHSRTKHIEVRYHFVREIFEEEKIILQKIVTSENPADMMTKVRDQSVPKSLTKKVIRMEDVSCPAIIIPITLSTISSSDIQIEWSFFPIPTKQVMRSSVGSEIRFSNTTLLSFIRSLINARSFALAFRMRLNRVKGRFIGSDDRAFIIR